MLNITVIYLIISIPIHFFIIESSFLSATSFLINENNHYASTKNTLAVYLNLLLPFAIFKFSRNINIKNFLFTLIISVGIFYTFSRAGLLLLFLNLFLFLFSFQKKFIYASLIIIITFIFLSLFFQLTPSKYNELKIKTNVQIGEEYYETDDVNKTFTFQSARFDYILKSYTGFLEKPFFGHGLTKFRYNHTYYDEEGNYIRNPPTHNDYAQILYEQGILGFLVFISLFIFNFSRILKSISANYNYSTILLIQLTIIAVSLNTINLLDHTIFWFIMAMTLYTKSMSQKQYE